MDLRITKARKPEWLAQNLDNPFRGWDGAEHIPASAAKKAEMCIRDRNIQRLADMEDPEFADFWQLLGYHDVITPEIQRMALALSLIHI